MRPDNFFTERNDSPQTSVMRLMDKYTPSKKISLPPPAMVHDWLNKTNDALKRERDRSNTCKLKDVFISADDTKQLLAKYNRPKK